ncbi:hypothetical protein C8Q74DRAFT_1374138 [Fomes fomentarius]|nr:hypothetical protein C8Q74DRAFT_1374138 [Fomes fomentarius]
MDYSYSRHSNSAAAPLLIFPVGQHFCVCPILTSSVTRVLSIDATSRSSPVPTLLVVQPPTPPHAEPATVQGPSPDRIPSSSGASSSEPYIQRNSRAKRTLVLKMLPLGSPAESTPTPAVYKAKNTPHVEKTRAFLERHVQFSGEEMPSSEIASSSQSAPRPNLHINPDTLKRPLAL